MKGLHLLLGPDRPFCFEAVPPRDLLLGLDTAETDGVAVLAAGAAAAGSGDGGGGGACCCLLASVVTMRLLSGVCPAAVGPAAVRLLGPSGSIFTAASLVPSAAADRVGILLCSR